MATVAIWEIDRNSPNRLGESPIRAEADLEGWITADPALLEEGLEIVGKQVSLDAGRLDLLALDPQGSWVVVEIKRGPAGRDALAQALDYASCVREREVNSVSVNFFAVPGVGVGAVEVMSRFVECCREGR